MGRTLLTGVFFCWLTLLGVAGIGKLTGLWSFPQFGSEPASLSECVDGMTTGLRREIASVGISAEQAGLHRARLDAATRPFCRAFIREPEATHLTKEDGPRLMREFLRQHPPLYEAICRVRLDADLVANAVIFRYLTATERRHLRDDMCRDQLAYLNAETGLIDYAGLIDERPDLYVSPVVRSSSRSSRKQAWTLSSAPRPCGASAAARAVRPCGSGRSTRPGPAL